MRRNKIMAYDVNKEEGNVELLKRILTTLQIYERDCMKKNETSSPSKVKTIIEEMCRED